MKQLSYNEAWAQIPPRTEEHKQRSREMLSKNLVEVEKQIQELKHQLATTLGYFQDINILWEQVKDDIKNTK